MKRHLFWILPLIGYVNCFWVYWLGNGKFEHDFSLEMAGLCALPCAALGAAIAGLINGPS